MTSPNDPLAFAKLIPGFDLMQQFAQAASGGASGAPGLTSWIAPIASVEELDKRIADLKAVQFWLEQNLHALRATVQALEVQKMTLAALQGMNLNVADIAKAFTVPAQPQPPQAQAVAAAPEPPSQAPPNTCQDAPANLPENPRQTTPPSPSSAASAAVPGMPDPLQWWGALTQQFQTIAANTMREAAQSVPPVDLAGAAHASGAVRKAKARPIRAPTAAKPAAPKAAPKKSTRRSAA